MSKKLKIKFWKAEKALAMQIVEQEGLPREKNDGTVRINCGAFITDTYVSLRSFPRYDYDIAIKMFDSNSDRDEYIDKITKAITDELFTGTGELKVGEMCEISENGVYWSKRIFVGEIDKSFGDEAPFMAVNFFDEQYITRWEHVRPLAKRTEPMVEENGEILTYTWEEK